MNKHQAKKRTARVKRVKKQANIARNRFKVGGPARAARHEFLPPAMMDGTWGILAAMLVFAHRSRPLQNK